jgi:hypothetical protein
MFSQDMVNLVAIPRVSDDFNKGPKHRTPSAVSLANRFPVDGHSDLFGAGGCLSMESDTLCAGVGGDRNW